ncbi:hypothetical protein RS130_09625 [Paraglaciecola aquimarina]|uniref:Uncharacterized protein n=1 Tax=Paraglaciecola aquimarina TaxID=1235557 RepID=A0ABU3SVW5_9ALTE|nr:hypothetical protein [Paraglaciecola aquimarina]MDU0354160.1 hypothetical protein [Paraglaciecola aquimarina]
MADTPIAAEPKVFSACLRVTFAGKSKEWSFIALLAMIFSRKT